MGRTRFALTLLGLVACGNGGDVIGMECDDVASLCGTLDSSTMDTPVRCAFGAGEVSTFRAPPHPTTVWETGFNAFENIEVDGLPFPFALNELDFWDGEEMHVSVVCDTDNDGEYTANDRQGVYGGDVAKPAVVPSAGLDITL